MELALQEAKKGLGRVAPNPLVGAVVIKNNKLISSGYHDHFGGMHAEEMALRKAGPHARGATLYVNLEPCHHFGKRPPCTKLIIESGIKTVVIASRDASQKSKTKLGLQHLKKHGVKIIENVCTAEAEALNWIYHFKHRHQKPVFILKMATTLDGKIATASGESKWITGPEAREKVQQLRSRVDAVLVGINTVLKDNPSLTVKKFLPLQQPLRIIFDSKLKIPLTAAVLDTKTAKTLMVTTTQAALSKINTLRSLGVGVKVLKSNGGQVDINDFMKLIIKWNLNAVLIEGGSEIAASFLKSKKVTHLYWFIAPKIMGGQKSLSAIGGQEIKKLTKSHRFSAVQSIEKLGDDLCLIFEYDPDHKN